MADRLIVQLVSGSNLIAGDDAYNSKTTTTTRHGNVTITRGPYWSRGTQHHAASSDPYTFISLMDAKTDKEVEKIRSPTIQV